MANEAVLAQRQPNSWASDYTVADGTPLTKGAICMLTDPRTASIATNGPVAVAGIAARDKVASDGRTQLAMWRDGVKFHMYASGSITVGDAVMVCALATTYPNFVEKATVAASGACIIGTAEQTVTNGQQVLVSVNIGGGNYF